MLRFFFFLIMLSFNVQAEVICYPPITQDELIGLMINTKIRYFPELDKEIVSVTNFKSKDSFLQAQPVIKSLLKRKEKRSYTVQVNPKLLACPPSMEGLEAILVHELEHIVDYTKWSSARIVKHGAKYLLSRKFQIKYERETDRKVLQKSLHEGLAQFREWIYPWLNPKQLKKKRQTYLTPEEIRNSL